MGRELPAKRLLSFHETAAKAANKTNQPVDWRVPNIINAPIGDRIAQIAMPLEAS